MKIINSFFVSYISSILPDLDVNGVTQNTIHELFLNYVNEKFIVNNSLDIIKEKDDIAYYKVSMNMKKDIDEYFNNLEIIPNTDFTINNIKILGNSFIKEIYNDINKNTFISVKSRIDRMILLLEKHINDNINSITRNLIKNNVNKNTIDEVKNNINNHLKKYFNVVNKKIKNIYIEILEKLNLDITSIKNDKVLVEDIPSLIYIKYKMFGSREFDNYKHIVIDEAQDYGEFTFYVLNKLFKNASFSIYGDLAQSLYPYRSIKNWECLEEIFDNFEILKLNKSYRTTIEIMEHANKINEKLGLDLAIPVIRHGDDVEYFENDVFDILNKIKDKYKSVAIITKDQIKAENIYNELKDKIDISLITSSNMNYNSNISILPSYLSKGLEFDIVIIVGEDNFNKDSVLDLKLLYVSKTRALHKLFIKK